MKYIRQTWSRFLISLLGGGILSELIFISTGDPNRPRHNGDFEGFVPLLCVAIIYITFTIIVNSRTIKFSEANDKSLEAFPNNKRKKYLWSISALSFITILLPVVFYRTGTTLGNLENSLMVIFFSLPSLSFILGIIIAIFPYRQFDFGKRYERAYWLGLLSLNIIVTLFTLTGVIIGIVVRLR